MGTQERKKNYIRTKAHISIKVTFQIKNNLQHYNILLRASIISMVLENNNKKNWNNFFFETSRKSFSEEFRRYSASEKKRKYNLSKIKVVIIHIAPTQILWRFSNECVGWWMVLLLFNIYGRYMTISSWIIPRKFKAESRRHFIF